MRFFFFWPTVGLAGLFSYCVWPPVVPSRLGSHFLPRYCTSVLHWDFAANGGVWVYVLTDSRYHFCTEKSRLQPYHVTWQLKSWATAQGYRGCGFEIEVEVARDGP